VFVDAPRPLPTVDGDGAEGAGEAVDLTLDVAINYLHTKNSLLQAKMARDIRVEEKSHATTLMLEHKKFKDLALLTNATGVRLHNHNLLHNLITSTRIL
jgi:hypothetical protein